MKPVCDTKKVNKRNTLMVAHRGISGIETENTASAFVAAGNRSYYGIETDVYRTADGKFMLFHDRELKRVGGEDILVEKCSLDVYQSVILIDKFEQNKSRADVRIATLENYIGICKKYGKVAVLELKSSFTQEEINRIIEIIKSYDFLDGVTFIAFEWENLEKVRAVSPEQPVQFLTCEYSEELVARLKAAKFDLDILQNQLTRENIKVLHDNGIKVNCWTVDDVERANELAEWGVDYITSNICE